MTAFTSLVSNLRPCSYSALPSIICSQATIPLVPSKSVERKSFILAKIPPPKLFIMVSHICFEITLQGRKYRRMKSKKLNEEQPLPMLLIVSSVELHIFRWFLYDQYKER